MVSVPGVVCAEALMASAVAPMNNPTASCLASFMSSHPLSEIDLDLLFHFLGNQPRIEGVAQGVADDVGGKNDHEDHSARHGDDVRRQKQQAAPFGGHGAEFRGGRLRA